MKTGEQLARDMAERKAKRQAKRQRASNSRRAKTASAKTASANLEYCRKSWPLSYKGYPIRRELAGTRRYYVHHAWNLPRCRRRATLHRLIDTLPERKP